MFYTLLKVMRHILIFQDFQLTIVPVLYSQLSFTLNNCRDRSRKKVKTVYVFILQAMGASALTNLSRSFDRTANCHWKRRSNEHSK